MNDRLWLLYVVLWLPTDTWYGLVVLRYLFQISLAGFFGQFVQTGNGRKLHVVAQQVRQTDCQNMRTLIYLKYRNIYIYCVQCTVYGLKNDKDY